MKPENPLQKEDIVLYQWPASEHCDSIYARCTKVQRTLGLLKVPYQVADIGLPNTHDQDKIKTKVKPLMKKIPILKIGKNIFLEETSVIVDYLIQTGGFKGFAFENPRSAAQAFFLDKWVEHWLEWMVIYARWVLEDNYRNWIITMGDLSVRVRSRKSMDYTRLRACEIIKTTEVGQLSERDYRGQLKAGLQNLEDLLNQAPFLTGATIKLVDLSVFMCLQVFSDPSFNYESTLMLDLPKLRMWMRSVDAITKTSFTRTPFADSL